MAGHGSSNKQDRDAPADVGNSSSSASFDPVVWTNNWRSPTTPSPSSSERELPVGRNSRPHPYADTRDIPTRQWLDHETPREDSSAGAQCAVEMLPALDAARAAAARDAAPDAAPGAAPAAAADASDVSNLTLETVMHTGLATELPAQSRDQDQDTRRKLLAVAKNGPC